MHAGLWVKVYGESICEQQGLILSEVEYGFILEFTIVPRIIYGPQSKN